MDDMMEKIMGGEGDMMGMMSGKPGAGEGIGMPMMGGMMIQMMPMCLSMMLPQLPREKREEFAMNLVSTLFDKGCADMSEEEKAAFRSKVAEKMGVSVCLT
ncbi:MAG: hypothetical protein R6U89_05525 [Dehalococcoidia bacterium]